MNLSFAFLDWNVVSSFILKGFLFSIQLTLVAMIGGIALGTAIALMRLSGNTAPRTLILICTGPMARASSRQMA